MFGIIADLLSSIVTILFPAFASFKAIRSGNPAQLTPWLMYWVVLSGVLLVESWTVFIIGWFPFYSWIRLFALSYLVLPQTQGARIIFQEYLDPFFEQHEREIEEFIGRAHERAKALGLQYFYQLIDLIREKVLRLPPQQPATAAPPQATGAAGYAQSLLSRFNLPSAIASNAPATGGDLYSLVTSAMTAITSTAQTREAQAEELSASGILHSDKVASLSRSEKVDFYSSQRERLQVLVAALEKEERKFTSDEDLAYGAPGGLRKNTSEHSFDQIDSDDLSGNSTHEGWTSGWFGGQSAATKRTVSGSARTEFAARAVDEISRASGFSR
ncbi:TB2/DP1, HVA22 family-domain-containing protein [Talaromyces proteolyticus]|uniref:Protein YOP1 n=1 Tax=Talaromyces proteolyticus TaxID=1131652 RepID=A0AAD4KZ35_9EURO|nr:TB2/DP1, HVA22 family-domain-containing protein [Talaromyces proteolyticus]KAH8703657.1 TB2/DP1, HVA22 family-domain-containing protein [Talaromyces proteolyticus]